MYMATRFTWDASKNRANLRKHGISFEMATKIFIDPNAIMRFDLDTDGEQRWQTIGCVDEGFLVVLAAHTLISDDSGELIRIISARKATPQERRLYEEGEYD
jgi:uncharacterized DUF497 family protein